MAVVVSSVRGGTNPWVGLDVFGDAVRMRAAVDRVTQLADEHGVVGWVLGAAVRAGVDTPQLRRSAASAMARHLRAVGDLEVCRAALDGAGIAFLVAKGPALNAVVHRDAALRSYVDLDLAVDRPVFPDALAALESAGLVLLDRNWTLLRAGEAQELRLRTASGGVVDLHSSLGRGPAGADPSPSVLTLVERGRPFDGPGGPVRTLAPADTVVHLAVHAADAGGHRLVWVADLRAALLRAGEAGLGARELDRTAQEWGAGPALSLMTRRVTRVLGDEVPREVTGAWSGAPRRSERSATWSALAGLDARLSPLSSGGSGTLPRLLARSARPTPRQSARAALGKGAAWARSGARRPVSAREAHDETNPRSSLYAAGDRSDFLAGLVSLVRPGEQATPRL
jgi:hypothetical protein